MTTQSAATTTSRDANASTYPSTACPLLIRTFTPLLYHKSAARGQRCLRNALTPSARNTTAGRTAAGIAGNHPFFATTIIAIVSP